MNDAINQNKSLIIRRASADDCMELGKIYCFSWKAAYHGIVPAEFLDSLTPENCAPPASKLSSANCIVSDASGRLNGLINFGTSRDNASDTFGEIRSIYVMPDSFRQGIGRKLLFAAFDSLKGSGFEGAFLWVLTDNHRARSFYESMGMRYSGEARWITIGGAELPEMKYTIEF